MRESENQYLSLYIPVQMVHVNNNDELTEELLEYILNFVSGKSRQKPKYSISTN